MDKIKAFFQKKAVKAVAWIVLTFAVGVLIVSGTTAEEISKDIVLTCGIVTAVGALVAYITSKIQK